MAAPAPATTTTLYAVEQQSKSTASYEDEWLQDWLAKSVTGGGCTTKTYTKLWSAIWLFNV